MLNKFKIWLNELKEHRLFIKELRAKEDAEQEQKIKEAEHLASRPSISTITNAPRHEVKKAA